MICQFQERCQRRTKWELRNLMASVFGVRCPSIPEDIWFVDLNIVIQDPSLKPWTKPSGSAYANDNDHGKNRSKLLHPCIITWSSIKEGFPKCGGITPGFVNLKWIPVVEGMPIVSNFDGWTRALKEVHPNARNILHNHIDVHLRLPLANLAASSLPTDWETLVCLVLGTTEIGLVLAKICGI